MPLTWGPQAKMQLAASGERARQRPVKCPFPCPWSQLISGQGDLQIRVPLIDWDPLKKPTVHYSTQIRSLKTNKIWLSIH